MGKYVNSGLISNEKVIFEGNISIWSIMPKLCMGVILIPFWGIGLIVLLSAFIDYRTTELAVTNKRVIAKFGLIQRQTIEMNIAKVESIQVSQGIFGRLMNYGDIIISGAGNPQTPIPGIRGPLEFKKRYFEIQELAA